MARYKKQLGTILIHRTFGQAKVLYSRNGLLKEAMGVRKKKDLPENATLIVELQDGTRKAILVQKEYWTDFSKVITAFNGAKPEPKAKPQPVRPIFRSAEVEIEEPKVTFAGYDSEELSELEASY